MVKISPSKKERELYDVLTSFGDEIVKKGKVEISRKINEWIESRFEELLGGKQFHPNMEPYISIGEKILRDDYSGLKRPIFVDNERDLIYGGKRGIAKNQDGIVYVPRTTIIPKLLGENYDDLRKMSGMGDEEEFLKSYQKRTLLHEYIETAYREANNITERDLSDDEHGEVESIVLGVLEYLSAIGNKTADRVYKVALSEHMIRGYDDTLTKYTSKYNYSLAEVLRL